MKSSNLTFPEQESALSEVRNRTEAIAESEAQIAECLKLTVLAKAMLASTVAELKTETRELHVKALKASRTAWRASLKAYALRIVYHRSVIDGHKQEIEVTLKRTPEARRDN